MGLQSVEELCNRLNEIEVSTKTIEAGSSSGGRRSFCSQRRFERATAAEVTIGVKAQAEMICQEIESTQSQTEVEGLNAFLMTY